MKPIYNRTPVQPRKSIIAQTTTRKITIILLIMPLSTTQTYSTSPTPAATHPIIHSHQATTPTKGKTKMDLIISHSQSQMGMTHLSQNILHLILPLIKNSKLLPSQ